MNMPVAARRLGLQLTRRVGPASMLRRALGSRSGKAGAILLAVVVGIALIGPVLSSGSTTAVVGPSFQPPSEAHPLGTDFLGRDALSRFLAGGATLIAVSTVSTLLAYVVGVIVGMAAGYRGGAFDNVSTAVLDVLISFPPIVLVLLLVAGGGSGLLMVVAAIAAVQSPRIARITRTCTLEVANLEYVEAAVARGESRWMILARDILPNVSTPLLADFGVRLTVSIILFSSLSYLGLGPAPPAADWGLMISENRVGLLSQPWTVIAPALAIAGLAVGVNLIADSISRTVGRSLVTRDV